MAGKTFTKNSPDRMKIAGKVYDKITQEGRKTLYQNEGGNAVLIEGRNPFEAVEHNIVWDIYKQMGDMLNERQNVTAYVHEIPGTPSDVVMMDTPKDLSIKAVMAVADASDKNLMFADMTTQSMEEDFARAVTDIDAKTGLER